MFNKLTSKLKSFKLFVGKKSPTPKRFVLLVYALFGLVLISIVSSYAFEIYYSDKVYQGVYLSNQNVGGYDYRKLDTLLKQKSDEFFEISVIVDGEVFKIKDSEVDISYDTAATFSRLKSFSKNQYKLAILAFLRSTFGYSTTEPVLLYNENNINSFIDYITVNTVITPTLPRLVILENIVDFEQGTNGTSLDTQQLKNLLLTNFEGFNNLNISINTQNVDTSLTEKQVEIFIQRGSNLIKNNILIEIANQEVKIDPSTILSFLTPTEGYNEKEISKFVESIEKEYNSPAKEPVFNFENGKVVEFTPATFGVVINPERLQKDIKDTLVLAEDSSDGEFLITAEFQTLEPKTKTEEVNTYGIRELVGIGTSDYSGSISSRVHNLTLAASKFNGILVAPGEIFSFNKTLGDVSKVTGYQQAYIIQDGQTVLGDGGGVCQVSTTLFRAILNAGLPVIERRAHSYRVGYYENDSPPGLDATVFDPHPDLSFKNDTDNYLLIQTSIDKTKRTLTFELFGTKDGRIATTTKPVVTSSTPPPEDLYIDDPTLPTGTVKQIDYKAWGAKVVFDYSVEKNGEIIFEKTFYSNYLPWQAKFLRGTGPV